MPEPNRPSTPPLTEIPAATKAFCRAFTASLLSPLTANWLAIVVDGVVVGAVVVGGAVD